MVSPSRGSQSLFLLQEADTTHEWSTNEIAEFLKCQTRLIPAEPADPVSHATDAPEDIQSRLTTVAARVAVRLEPTEIGALVEAFERVSQIPAEIDRQLLGGARAEMARDLNPGEKRDIRKYFIEKCKEQMN